LKTRRFSRICFRAVRGNSLQSIIFCVAHIHNGDSLGSPNPYVSKLESVDQIWLRNSFVDTFTKASSKDRILLEIQAGPENEVKTEIYVRLAVLSRKYDELDKKYKIIMSNSALKSQEKAKFSAPIVKQMADIAQERGSLNDYLSENFTVRITNTNKKEQIEALVSREVIEDYLKGKAVKSMEDWTFWNWVFSTPVSYFTGEKKLDPGDILPNVNEKPLRVEYGVQKDRNGGCLVFLADNNQNTTRIKGEIVQMPISKEEKQKILKADKKVVRTF
jgi:hypothetical protein